VGVTQTTPEQVASLAKAILEALAGVETASGVEAGAGAAEMLVRLALFHVFNHVGPQATRDMMFRLFTDLEASIAAANAGSSAIS
jgi:hypothetical protein